MARLERVIWGSWMAALRLHAGEEGQGLAEYGLILALVAVVTVGAVTLLGTHVKTTLNSIAGSI